MVCPASLFAAVYGCFFLYVPNDSCIQWIQVTNKPHGDIKSWFIFYQSGKGDKVTEVGERYYYTGYHNKMVKNGGYNMAAVALSKEMFEEKVLENKQLTVVDFWAPWCTYCRRIEPAYEKIGSEYGDKLLVGKVNIDDEPSLAEKYQVEIIPTLMLFKDGEPVGHIVAPDSKARIESFINEHLG